MLLEMYDVFAVLVPKWFFINLGIICVHVYFVINSRSYICFVLRQVVIEALGFRLFLPRTIVQIYLYDEEFILYYYCCSGCIISQLKLLYLKF